MSEYVVTGKARVCKRIRDSILKKDIAMKGNDMIHSSVVVRKIAVKRGYIVRGTVVTRSAIVKGSISVKVKDRIPGGVGPGVCDNKLTAVKRGSIVPKKMRVKGGATVDKIASSRSCVSKMLTDNRALVGTNSEM